MKISFRFASSFLKISQIFFVSKNLRFKEPVFTALFDTGAAFFLRPPRRWGGGTWNLHSHVQALSLKFVSMIRKCLLIIILNYVDFPHTFRSDVGDDTKSSPFQGRFQRENRSFCRPRAGAVWS